MKIHLFDDDPRQHDPDYPLNHGSFAAVHRGLNKALAKIGAYAEPDDADFVGCCDGLKIDFKYKNKESFLISVWEYQNTLTDYHLINAERSGQKLFGLSDQITNLWRKYGFSCETIYGGCDTDFWHKTKDTNPNQFQFCSVNSSTIRSGLEIQMLAFAHAFQNNKDVVYIIKDTNDSERLRQVIDKLNINFNCRIIYKAYRGPSTDIRDLYSESHVTLNVLRMTSLGMPILDCMACGSLCITGDVEPLNEMTNKDVALLVPSNGTVKINGMKDYLTSIGLRDCYPRFSSPEEPEFYDYDMDKLSAGMKKVYENYSKFDGMREKAIDHVEFKWNWDLPAAKLVVELSK